MMWTRLFVIEREGAGGPAWWCCSPEHGSGWHDKYPKQAFSKSELVREIARLIEEGWMPSVVRVRELQLGEGA